MCSNTKHKIRLPGKGHNITVVREGAKWLVNMVSWPCSHQQITYIYVKCFNEMYLVYYVSIVFI